MTQHVLDLFSGTGSATAAFRERDKYEVTEIDIKCEPEKGVEPDIQADVLELEPEDLPDADIIWASPPCTTFSRASMGNHWDGNMMPATEQNLQNIQLVWRTLYLINELQPTYWFLENPQGMLRNVLPHEPEIITYCQYGHDAMKPTYLYGRHPRSMEYRRCSEGSGCHVSAPRGSNHQGTQSSDKDAVERSKVPKGLSEAIADAVENPGGSRQADIAEVMRRG